MVTIFSMGFKNKSVFVNLLFLPLNLGRIFWYTENKIICRINLHIATCFETEAPCIVRISILSPNTLQYIIHVAIGVDFLWHVRFPMTNQPSLWVKLLPNSWTCPPAPLSLTFL